MKPTIPIFYTIDENYAPYLAVSVSSLIDNASSDYNYVIYVINDGLKHATRDKIKRLATENVKIEFQTMQKSLSMIPTKDLLNADYFTLTIYFRIFLPMMFPQYDKGIYIDSDTVVPGDISELFNIELGDCFMGAVKDKNVAANPIFGKYMDEAVGIDKNNYINSGVLLINMKKLRDVDFEGHFLSLLNTYQFDTIAPDQDYINVMCYGNMYYLDEVWNTMPSEVGDKVNEPKLIHFNLFSKPWFGEKVDHEEVFWHYADNSEFSKIIRKRTDDFTDKDRESNKERLESMLSRAEQICEYGTTFASVINQGKAKRI